MNISIIGAGYVGLVTGACLASQGFDVLCCDSDKDKVGKLENGILPIYEPGLSELVCKCMYDTGKLFFTDSMARAINYSDILVVTVNTPTLPDNSCNLAHIFQVAEEIAHNMACYKAIVHKSTVPVGTGRKVKALISGILKERSREFTFDVVSNPEFLREGSAISDFLKPDRIVIGSESTRATSMLKELYSYQLDAGTPILETGIETAEMIKYASNAFLAAKISFVNEIANICELCGADGIIVSKGMGMDGRIGPGFLEPGPGFGGSCFPKDVKALSGMAGALGYDSKLINSILEANAVQKARMLKKIEAAAGPLENKVISILGLSFKPETDDIRESPSISIIEGLIGRTTFLF